MATLDDVRRIALDLPATVTDGAGKAVLEFDASQAQGQDQDTAEPLKALVTANVFEPSGRPVSSIWSRPRSRRIWIFCRPSRPLILRTLIVPGS